MTLTPFTYEVLLCSAAISFIAIIVAIGWGIMRGRLDAVLVSIFLATAVPVALVTLGIVLFDAQKNPNPWIGNGTYVIAIVSALPFIGFMKAHWGIRLALAISYGPALAGFLALYSLFFVCSVYGDCL